MFLSEILLYHTHNIHTLHAHTLTFDFDVADLENDSIVLEHLSRTLHG